LESAEDSVDRDVSGAPHCTPRMNTNRLRSLSMEKGRCCPLLLAAWASTLAAAASSVPCGAALLDGTSGGSVLWLLLLPWLLAGDAPKLRPCAELLPTPMLLLLPSGRLCLGAMSWL